MSNQITTEQWTQAAAISLRLLLVDPEATLTDESRLSIQALVDNAPAGLYDNLDPRLQPTLNLITLIEVMTGVGKK